MLKLHFLCLFLILFSYLKNIDCITEKLLNQLLRSFNSDITEICYEYCMVLLFKTYILMDLAYELVV